MWADCRNPTGAKHHRTITVDGVRIGVHRAAWQSAHGPIPEGMVVRHKCDYGPCDNIEHLEIGTQSDNIKDAVERGRFVNNLPPPVRGTHCSQGHEYDGRLDTRGQQICTPCDRKRKREWMRAKRAEARA